MHKLINAQSIGLGLISLVGLVLFVKTFNLFAGIRNIGKPKPRFENSNTRFRSRTSTLNGDVNRS